MFKKRGVEVKEKVVMVYTLYRFWAISYDGTALAEMLSADETATLQ